MILTVVWDIIWGTCVKKLKTEEQTKSLLKGVAPVTRRLLIDSIISFTE